MTNTTPIKSATILLSRGDQDALYRQAMLSLVERIEAASPEHVKCVLAFSDLSAPTLDDTVNTLLEQGIDQIDVLPLVFAANSTLREDLPERIDRLTKQLQENGHHLRLSLHPPIGQEPELTRALSDVVTRYVAESSYRLF